MSRRKNRDSGTTAQLRSVRQAAPTHDLISLTPRSALVASAVSTAAVLGTAGIGLGAGAAAACVASVFAAIGGKVRGRTAGEWIALHTAKGALPEQAALFSRDGVGVVFDGHTVTALVEITPRPWQVTCVSATGGGGSPVISADVLRRQLRRYDIGLSRIDVICAGYKFASNDNAAGVLDTLIGPVSVPLGGCTVVAVSLDLEADILEPAYARTRRDSLPHGLCQALTIAATRVRNALAEQGFGGRLMSAQQIRDFHDAVLAQVVRALAVPKWRTCGATSGVHTRTYAPGRGHWNAESAGSWNHLQAHRQYTTLTLTPQGEGRALAQPLVTYLVRSGDALAKAESYGLRSAGGQQVAGLSRALPVATHSPLRSTGVIIDDQRQLGFGIPAGGAGFFVGSQADKTRVFVAVSPAEEPLWLAGPPLFALQMVARLSTQDQRIAVMIDEPRWQHLVAHRNTPALTLGTVETTPADVVVCTPQWWEEHRKLTAGKAVLLVTEGAAGKGATNTLVVETAEGCSEIVVSADEQSIRVPWELTPMERRILLGDVDVAGTAAPRERIDLLLGDVVKLPEGAKPQVTRADAPIPVIPTPGQVVPGQVPAAAPPTTQQRQLRQRIPRPVSGPPRPVPAAPSPPSPLRPSSVAKPPSLGPVAVPPATSPAAAPPPLTPPSSHSATSPRPIASTPERGEARWKGAISSRAQDYQGRHHRAAGKGDG
ncbi:type VII secretion protein EccE [Mycobacteroides abscessus]|uniref:type VII secretion protein EccE n=1 Tax=Mycobacteroides abscessus TaxID=36809 RepID=UPI0005EA4898|nr:type VII secretion protein EccE [Mycobacteroides abscessus]CPW66890.1 type VII secretion protein EccE [Mycobacteroides abscessus]SKF61956.1 type VII secretion protein EccE [Mycobacteroides abscessus subsp. bolletii]SKH89370.1 type VII secretion protein EccE [Mycobacteroides abscessus subsp. bolletii]